MSRLIIFKAQSTLAPGWQDRTFPGGGLSDILGQHHDYSDRPLIGPGYRLPEFKNDEAAATFDHRGGATHHRSSAWKVSRIDEYVCNTHYEDFLEVAIAYCEYEPLPESENPWVEMMPARVSADSFGGDQAAFERWQATQPALI